MNTIHVLFRACDAVHSVHGEPRPFGLDKTRLVKLCFASLTRALAAVPHRIEVIGDRLSPDLRAFFDREGAPVHPCGPGNDESLRECVRRAAEAPPEDWVYFCEDDYLHRQDAFEIIADLIRNRRSVLRYEPGPEAAGWTGVRLEEAPLVIHPPDYPDRYSPPQLRRSLVFCADRSHWRQIANTTFTFLMEGSSVRAFRDVLIDCATGADDAALSKRLYADDAISGRALCLSPLPGVATHMHETTMTPLLDWRRIFDDTRIWLEERLDARSLASGGPR